MRFPEYDIPFENVNSVDPARLSILQNERTERGTLKYIPVPSYWKRRNKRRAVSDETYRSTAYHCPLFLKETRLLEIRARVYSADQGMQKRNQVELTEMGAELLGSLQNGCEKYVFNPIMDHVYDGTESFFLNGCVSGRPSDELIGALGGTDRYEALVRKRTEWIGKHGAVDMSKATPEHTQVSMCVDILAGERDTFNSQQCENEYNSKVASYNEQKTLKKNNSETGETTQKREKSDKKKQHADKRKERIKRLRF